MSLSRLFVELRVALLSAGNECDANQDAILLAAIDFVQSRKPAGFTPVEWPSKVVVVSPDAPVPTPVVAEKPKRKAAPKKK